MEDLVALRMRYRMAFARGEALEYTADEVQRLTMRITTPHPSGLSTALRLRQRWALSVVEQRAFAITAEELSWVELEIRGKEYTNWRDDDSPKGETVPGVRYRPDGEAVRGVGTLRGFSFPKRLVSPNVA